MEEADATVSEIYDDVIVFWFSGCFRGRSRRRLTSPACNHGGWNEPARILSCLGRRG